MVAERLFRHRNRYVGSTIRPARIGQDRPVWPGTEAPSRRLYRSTVPDPYPPVMTMYTPIELARKLGYMDESRRLQRQLLRHGRRRQTASVNDQLFAMQRLAGTWSDYECDFPTAEGFFSRPLRAGDPCRGQKAGGCAGMVCQLRERAREYRRARSVSAKVAMMTETATAASPM